jgi:hypothetical protein
MGLKGYRLWVMGQLDSNVQSPTTNRVTPGSVNPSRACGTQHQVMTADVVRVTNPVTPGSE